MEPRPVVESPGAPQDSPLEKGLGRDRLRMSTEQAAHGGLGGVGVGRSRRWGASSEERGRAMGVQGGRGRGPPPGQTKGAG